jgi:hypothetical protein
MVARALARTMLYLGLSLAVWGAAIGVAVLALRAIAGQ